MARAKSDETRKTETDEKPKAVRAKDTSEDKPKRTGRSKAEDVVEDVVAEEKPKRAGRAKKEESSDDKPKRAGRSKKEETEEVESEEKPKRAGRAKKEESSEEKPKRAGRSKKEESTVDDGEESDESGEKTRRVRKVVTYEDVSKKFASVIQSLENELSSMREKKDTRGSKLLRSVKVNLKELNSDCARLAKGKKPKTKREGAGNNSGGFNKPVAISGELAEFIGSKPGELVSRNAVTRCVCSYIKEHNLQNPGDRRQILPDTRLKKLFNWSESDQPIRYPTIQQKINHHYLK